MLIRKSSRPDSIIAQFHSQMEIATCYHEAGHCLAAVHLGHVAKNITDAGLLELGLKSNPNLIFNRGVIAAAGPLAEHKFRPTTKDQRIEFWHGTAWKVDGEKIKKVKDTAAVFRRARRIVDKYWLEIEKVAAALAQRGELTGAEIDELLTS
jgi:hypothetical protein